MKLTFCALCGDKNNLEHHHVIPKSKGGSDSADNLLTLCSTHHCQIHNFSKSRINSGTLIKEAKQKNKAAGKFLGGHTPFGYNLVNDTLIENPEEQAIIVELITLKANGMSYRKLASHLLLNYGVTRSHSTVKGILDEYKVSC